MERFLNNPKHIQSHELLYLCHLIDKQDIIINIKADGIHKQFKFNNDTYEGEIINDFTYIFDILNYPLYLNQSYKSRYEYIKNKYNIDKQIKLITSFDEFIHEITNDDLKYIELQKENKIILKQSYLIKMSSEDFLKILDKHPIEYEKFAMIREQLLMDENPENI
jgi:hypothetical protein